MLLRKTPPLLLLPVLLLAPCESLPGTWMFGLFLVDDVATSYNTNDFTTASTGTSNPREQSHPRNPETETGPCPRLPTYRTLWTFSPLDALLALEPTITALFIPLSPELD